MLCEQYLEIYLPPVTKTIVFAADTIIVIQDERYVCEALCVIEMLHFD